MRMSPAYWSFIFVAQLPIPLLLASNVTPRDGGHGLLAAMGLLWLFGLVVGSSVPGVGRRLVVGGLFVALLQLIPMLQVIAGSIGLSCAAAAEGSEMGRGSGYYQITSAWGEFIAATITGGILMVVAWILGFVFVPIGDGR